MLRYRLIFGTLMVLFFIGITVLGAWLDGTISAEIPDKAVKGSILAGLLVFLAIPAQIELAGLLKRDTVKVFPVVTTVFSILLATNWYWPQFFGKNSANFQLNYILFVTALLVITLFIYQAKVSGYEGVVHNCGANLLAVLYLGFLSGFVLGIRIDFGIWPLLMFIFTVKFADIGAFTFGKIFGKHKFSPVISPNKTWEGLFGAVIASVLISVIFAAVFNIMSWFWAAVFGAGFAVMGQLGDLAESMFKRDAAKKDSASAVPGFGGVLDVIDSPLATAPAAYLFFKIVVSI